MLAAQKQAATAHGPRATVCQPLPHITVCILSDPSNRVVFQLKNSQAASLLTQRHQRPSHDPEALRDVTAGRLVFSPSCSLRAGTLASLPPASLPFCSGQVHSHLGALASALPSAWTTFTSDTYTNPCAPPATRPGETRPPLALSEMMQASATPSKHFKQLKAVKRFAWLHLASSF